MDITKGLIGLGGQKPRWKNWGFYDIIFSMDLCKDCKIFCEGDSDCLCPDCHNDIILPNDESYTQEELRQEFD